MNLFIKLSFLIFASLAQVPLAFAQTASDVNEGLSIHNGSSAGSFELRWYGKPGRTYFIQTSETLMPDSWAYIPLIESGTGAVLQSGFTNPNTRYFLRLKYTDVTFTGPVGDADFDTDGLTNNEELALHETDPLHADTDGDGLEDGEEIALGSNPLAGDSDFDGYSDSEERHRQTNPMSASSNPDPGSNGSDSPFIVQTWFGEGMIDGDQGGYDGSYFNEDLTEGDSRFIENGEGFNEESAHRELMNMIDNNLNHRTYGPDITDPDHVGDVSSPKYGGHGFSFGWRGESYMQSSSTGNLWLKRTAVRIIAKSPANTERVVTLFFFRTSTQTNPTPEYLNKVLFRIPANETLA